MKQLGIVFMLMAALACTQKPALVVEEQKPLPAADRPAIAVEYVAVPTLSVFAEPVDTAPLTGTYSFNESISIIAIKGDWKQIRTFNGAGWVRATDLMTGAQATEFATNPAPRFYQPPTKIDAKAFGEIVFEAKVNPEGEVYEVKTLSNTTGMPSLADQNSTALSQARFYPMSTKDGRRTFFTYHHIVTY
ncbi:MAG: SH3 domain-containing protein [Thermoanaerobaculia bacterium]|nr:SH3 domain-containing protein [Thermoanaerobaculia bacterium]